MGCNTCGQTMIGVSQQSGHRIISHPVMENCDITKDMLIVWKAILTCVKLNRSFTRIQLEEYNINQLLGVVQSALNYPDDYCYYYEQLSYFKATILPQLITNVPECIN